MKKRWEKILRENLLHDPSWFSRDKLYKKEHRNDFFTSANVVVTIKTKWKHYTFGGPIYSAAFSLRSDGIHIHFPVPVFRKKQQYLVSWEKITAVELIFLP